MCIIARCSVNIYIYIYFSGIHLILMIVWITIIKPDFGTTACERHLFTLVSAIIHIFCFLNLKDGRSRWRMLVYYLVILIENSVLILIWFVYKHIGAPPWLVPLGFSVVFGGFLFGVLVMLLYYGCCHPSGPAPIPARKPEFHKPPAFVDQVCVVFLFSQNIYLRTYFFVCLFKERWASLFSAFTSLWLHSIFIECIVG